MRDCELFVDVAVKLLLDCLLRTDHDTCRPHAHGIQLPGDPYVNSVEVAAIFLKEHGIGWEEFS